MTRLLPIALVLLLWAAMLFGTKWARRRRQQQALLDLGDAATFAPDNTPKLIRALRTCLETNAAPDVLRKQKSRALAAIDRIFEKVRPNREEYTESPEYAADSDLVELLLEAYAFDPGFRRDFVDRLAGETSEAVWFEVVFSATCEESLVNDRDAFRNVFDRWMALEKDAPARRSVEVVGGIVEWAVSLEEKAMLAKLKPLVTELRDQADDKRVWDDILQDFEDEQPRS